MATVKEQQLEALKDSADYMDRLIPSMEQVIAEIRGEMQDDTIDFLHQVVNQRHQSRQEVHSIFVCQFCFLFHSF